MCSGPVGLGAKRTRGCMFSFIWFFPFRAMSRTRRPLILTFVTAKVRCSEQTMLIPPLIPSKDSPNAIGFLIEFQPADLPFRSLQESSLMGDTHLAMCTLSSISSLRTTLIKQSKPPLIACWRNISRLLSNRFSVFRTALPRNISLENKTNRNMDQNEAEP